MRNAKGNDVFEQLTEKLEFCCNCKSTLAGALEQQCGPEPLGRLEAAKESQVQTDVARGKKNCWGKDVLHQETWAC